MFPWCVLGTSFSPPPLSLHPCPQIQELQDGGEEKERERDSLSGFIVVCAEYTNEVRDACFEAAFGWYCMLFNVVALDFQIVAVARELLRAPGVLLRIIEAQAKQLVRWQPQVAADRDRRLVKWFQLPAFPLTSELHMTDEEWQSAGALKETRAAYDSLAEYLQVTYSLLRAETFMPLSQALRALQTEGKRPDAFVNSGASVDGIFFDMRDGVCLTLNLHVAPAGATRLFNSGKLKFGSLLCLSEDQRFKAPLFATVRSRDELKSGLVDVKLESADLASVRTLLALVSLGSEGLTIVESPVYFNAYGPALRRLQDISEAAAGSLDSDGGVCPLLEDLGKGLPSKLPAYLADPDATVDAAAIGGLAGARTTLHALVCALQSSRLTFPCDLDLSQQQAVALALSNSVALIQGPPGTGKTFVAARIISLLLSLSTWDQELPLVIITQKNHALDQLLLSLVKVGVVKKDDIVRLGSRGSEELKECNLKEVMQKEKHLREFLPRRCCRPRWIPLCFGSLWMLWAPGRTHRQ